jgi:hypothetical protein
MDHQGPLIPYTGGIQQYKGLGVSRSCGFCGKHRALGGGAVMIVDGMRTWVGPCCINSVMANARQLPLQERITIVMLAHGVDLAMMSDAIVARTGSTVSSVSKALLRMESLGRVLRVGKGVSTGRRGPVPTMWRLIDTDDDETPMRRQHVGYAGMDVLVDVMMVWGRA